MATRDSDAFPPVSSCCLLILIQFFPSFLFSRLAYVNLAAILARQNREAEAEYAYRKALIHRPNMAETHFNL